MTWRAPGPRCLLSSTYTSHPARTPDEPGVSEEDGDDHAGGLPYQAEGGHRHKGEDSQGMHMLNLPNSMQTVFNMMQVGGADIHHVIPRVSKRRR